MPGLVNCHGHSPMTLVRGAGDGLPLDRWLTESVWPREARLADEDVYWGMTLGAAELLTNGVTTTCEQYRHPAPVVEACSTAASGPCTAGMFEVPGSPDGPGRTGSAAGRGVRAVGRRGRARRPAPSRVRAARRLRRPAEGLPRTRPRAERRDTLLQIHLSDRGGGRGRGSSRYGLRAPRAAGRRRRARRAVLAAHAVWLDDDDLAIWRATTWRWRTARGPTASSAAGVARSGASSASGSGSGWARTARPPTTTCTCGTRCAWRRSWPGRVAGDPGALTRRRRCTWPPRGVAATPSGSRSVRSRWGGRPTSSACAPTTRLRAVGHRGGVLGHLVWAGAGCLVTDVWVGGACMVEAGRCTHIDEGRTGGRGGPARPVVCSAPRPVGLLLYARLRRSGPTPHTHRRRRRRLGLVPARGARGSRRPRRRRRRARRRRLARRL